jgi:hypothetical protein
MRIYILPMAVRAQLTFFTAVTTFLCQVSCVSHEYVVCSMAGAGLILVTPAFESVVCSARETARIVARDELHSMYM